MELCTGERFDSHGEVAYEGNTCPLCEVKKELNEQVDELNGKVNDLESQLEDAQHELQEATSG